MAPLATARACAAIAGALLALAAPQPLFANSHQWRFQEFYSSPDRSVQFIEMVEIAGSDDETRIANHWFQTDGYNLDNSELLGRDLPFGTAHKTFLVGTESYAALPGVPEPDYVLPDGFLDPDGDTVVWWFYEHLEIPPNTMPSDGVDSLHVDDALMDDPTSVSFSVAPNSPKNFAGETGTVNAVPEPSSGLLAVTGLLAVVALAGLRRRYGPVRLRRSIRDEPSRAQPSASTEGTAPGPSV